MPLTDVTVIANSQQWLERAVIGLNLCPFARAPYLGDQVRFAVSQAETPDALLEDLIAALQELAATNSDSLETTLLIHPRALLDFMDFNDFLAVADATLDALDLDGIIQIASFHPQYQFAGTDPDAMENFSNRSPYPTLHLLRESSVAWAADAMPDPDSIYRDNIARLERLGRQGWEKLWQE
ncbi:MAG: DUF1415 domain-containing protein [Oleiphilaceae bacterium]|nr:DUF1415 domain-containing protein [Oleiphilaceae bacterium]